ncbi:MAG TPA: urease accessory protein UreE [Drouetiella sp.]
MFSKSKSVTVNELRQDVSNIDPTHVEYIDLDWEDRRRPRRKVKTDSGLELALALKRGTILSDGDILYADENKVVVVRAKSQEVVCIHPLNFNQATRVSHFLGNWHRSIQTTETGLLITELDAPFKEWLTREQINFEVETRPYHPNLKGTEHA